MKNVILTLPLAILTIAALSSCATPYRAADSYLSRGYSEMPVDSITYLVDFVGNGDTSPELMNRYTLYHSAELTLQKGYDHFLFMDKWRGVDMIRMFHGPGDIANSFDAKAIVTTMAPQIQR